MKRAGKLLSDFESKPEAEKAKLVWSLTALLMVLVFSLWASGAANNFARLGQGAEWTGRMEGGEFDLVQELEDGKNLLDQMQSYGKSTLEELGNDFIREKELLPADGFSALELTEAKWEGGNVRLTYAQSYKSVPVSGAGLELRLDPNTRAVTLARDTIERNLALAVEPQLSGKDAARIATAASSDSTLELREAKLLIVAAAGGHCLVWNTLFAGEAGEKEIWVGAQNGNIVSQTPTENQTSNITR